MLLWLVVVAVLQGTIPVAYAAHNGTDIVFGAEGWVPEHVRMMPFRLDAKYWVEAARRQYAAQNVDVSASCEELIGQGYVERWTNSRVEYCPAASAGDSSMTCYTHPRRPNADGTVTCLNRNIVLDSAAFLEGGGRTSNQRPKDTDLPSPSKGSLRVSCTIPDPRPIPDSYVQHSDGDRIYFVNALQDNDLTVRNICDPASSSSIVPHPVMFIGRWDPTNPWHHHEDLVNLFVQLYFMHDQLEEVRTKGLQVIVIDTKPRGWFLEIWRRISWPHPVRFLAQDPLPNGTCLPLMLQHGRPEVSLYCAHGVGHAIDCRSAVMTAFQSWQQALFAEVYPYRYALQPRANPAVQVRRILWASRRNQESLNLDRMTSWQVNRIIQNEDNLVQRLMELVLKWNARSCIRTAHPSAGSRHSTRGLAAATTSTAAGGRLQAPTTNPGTANMLRGNIVSDNTHSPSPSLSASPNYSPGSGTADDASSSPVSNSISTPSGGSGSSCRNSSLLFEFVVAEPSDLTFYPEQLSMMARTNIFMAIHGAGMVMHNSRGNYHYHNTAKWLGVDYVSVDNFNIEDIGQAMLGAMDRMEQRHSVSEEHQRRHLKRRRSV